MVKILRSMHTPGIHARETELPVGTKHKYKLLDGKIIEAVTTSIKCLHPNGCYGYEVTENGIKYFHDEERIESFEVPKE